MPSFLASSRAAALSASVGLVLVVAGIAVPQWTGEDVGVHWPPLHADWDPRLGRLTIVAIAVGLLLWQTLPRIADRLPWPAVPASGFVGTWIWTMVLALTEGKDGLGRTFERPGEYVYDAQRVKAIGPMLDTFIERIPYAHPDNWHTHVAGHPPGALLFFVIVDRLGIEDPFWIGVIVVTIGSTATAAVLLTLKSLSTARLARKALPWIVLAPTAVWMGVNGDALFTAVAAWGLALLAIAATSRKALPAIGAGLLLGLCVYLSYGLVLLGILALGVLIIARSWRPLPWALGGAGVVAALFTAAGFAWWRAYPVLVERYNDGIASERSYGYWVWANIAAWTFTVGLAVWAAFPRSASVIRERNPLALLATAALLTIVVATLSGMSKAEVERIWLPFTIWVVALPALLPERWHRPLLLSQVVLALCVQQVLLTRW